MVIIKFIERYNENKDATRVDYICSRLKEEVKNITGYETEFFSCGSKEDGSFLIYNMDIYSNNPVFVNLRMELHYPDKELFKLERDIVNLSPEKIEKYAERKYAKSKMGCAEILDFVVTPKNQGYGSKVVEALLNILKEVEVVDIVTLSPQGEDAARFWSRNRFEVPKVTDKELNIEYINNTDMVYIINH